RRSASHAGCVEAIAQQLPDPFNRDAQRSALKQRGAAMKNKLILDRVANDWFRARKARAIQARKLAADTQVETPEGPTTAKAGDWLCQGVNGEHWPQKEAKLFQTYTPQDAQAVERDPQAWHTFEPRPDGEGVLAAQVNEPFVVEAAWGTLTGRPGDYLVKA